MGSIITIKQDQTNKIYDDSVVGAGQLVRTVTLDAETLLVGLYVSALSAPLDLTVKTRTNEGVEKSVLLFPTINSPTSELVIFKVPKGFTNFDLVVDHQGNATFKLVGKGVGGSETPVYLTEAAEIKRYGSGKDFEYSGLSTPGLDQTLIDVTVPTGKRWELTKVQMNCRFESYYEVLIDDNHKGSGRTGPANPEGYFSWEHEKIANAGQNIKVKFCQNVNTPQITIGGYLNLTEIDVVSY